jgi:FKBP-type peptidyl-prolyl cis-trans isomerase FkpA
MKSMINRTMPFVLLAAMAILFAGCNNDDDLGPSAYEQFEKENQLIDAYVSENGLTVLTDPNTLLRYRVTSQGSGISVAFPLNVNNKVADSVTISYTARLLETEEIVRTVSSEKIAYEDLTAGIRLALQYVREGGSVNFFEPSAYGYGIVGSGDIPGNATLIYDLDLEDIHAEQLYTDMNKIEDYLADSLTAEQHITGLYYSIDQMGTGEHPRWGNVIKVTYTGKLLETGEVFDVGTEQNFLLQNLITGWVIGLQEIKPGGKMTMYVPSRMAYGSSGSSNVIPPNAILIFDIELVEVQ